MSNNQQTINDPGQDQSAWEQLKAWLADMGQYEKVEISVQELATTNKPKKLKIVRKSTNAITIEV